MTERPVIALMRANMSSFQKKVWMLIGKTGNPWGFIPEVPYEDLILDFYSETRKVCIEADGPHHALPERKIADRKREEFLLTRGIKTLHITPAMLVRYSLKDILTYIDNYMESATLKEGEDE